MLTAFMYLHFKIQWTSVIFEGIWGGGLHKRGSYKSFKVYLEIISS